MNLLIVTNNDLNTMEPWYLLRGIAEFGHVHVVAAVQDEVIAQPSSFKLIEPTLPEMQRRYPDASFYQIGGATLSDCVRLALTTPNWLPPIDVVLFGSLEGTCFGSNIWLSAQTKAALLAHELGVVAFSFFLAEGTPQQRDIISFAAERLLRAMLQLPQLPHIVLHVNVPNLRPNECEGFTVVEPDRSPQGVSRLNRASLPWTFHRIEQEEEGPSLGTDRWAIERSRVAVAPLWGWRPGNVATQLQAMASISYVVAHIGSSRAYRAAIDRLVNHEVKYDYHFKGAVLSAHPGFCTPHYAVRFAFEVDSVFEKPILEHASGQVLDVGCGPGRIAVYLMTERQNYVAGVVGVDSSPASLRDYEERWAREVSAPCITQCLDIRTSDLGSLGMFDTIVMLGDTLGIPGNRSGLAQLFNLLRTHVHLGGKLIASGRDPTKMTNPDEQFINDEAIRSGFDPGERYLRVSFENHDTGWFQWYYVSIEELRKIAKLSGWRLLEEHTCWRNHDQYGVVLQAV